MTTGDGRARRRAGWLAALVVLSLYGGAALAVDVPAATRGFFSDEATYYLMGHSLAVDGDLAYQRKDLQRAFREYPSGPTGLFLKRGVDVTGLEASFDLFAGRPDLQPARLYYGKSFAYPLAAAPFVRLFGTNGFLLLNALLIAAAFLAAYEFVSVQSGIVTGLLLASAFVFATVVPVYAFWITPELFNFALGLLAYSLWLQKHVVRASSTEPAGSTREGGALSDGLAAFLIGVLTFSKVTNVLLLPPMAAWLAWQRQWRRLLLVSAVWALTTGALFGANVAITGEWNYQGGVDRQTCGGPFPFQHEGIGLEVCDDRGRNEVQQDILFDPEVFWSNLRANLVYFVAGRHSGLLAYYFPAVFALVALGMAWRLQASWRWFVLAGIVAQVSVFIVTLPYTFFGGGGSVGNRYFMGVYGACLFLLPPVRSLGVAVIPWIVGGFFMAQLVLNPLAARPGDHYKNGVFRLLPVELTNVNDLPLNNYRDLAMDWYGDEPDLGYPGFQIFRLDENAYLQEADGLSFWTRGESTAQILIRTDHPVRRLLIKLRAGPVGTTVTVRAGGREQRLTLRPGGSGQMLFELPPGFPYKSERPPESPGPSYVWVASVTTDTGFTPVLVEADSVDVRYLGVRVKPFVIP